MTPLVLQDELVAELQKILGDHYYRTPAGTMAPMKVYPQCLPINETDDEDDPVPYTIVRLNNGEDDGTRDSYHTVKLVIVFAVWDDSLESQGHRDIANLIHKVYERFQRNPNLNGKAVFQGEFNWMLQDDNYYPYSFGACSLRFHIAAIRREDPFV